MDKSKSKWFDTRFIIALFLLPLILAEVITGTIGFEHILNPVLMINLLLLYGIGNILIYEVGVRMQLKAGIIFLAIGYGIYEEGFSVLSFFNNSHPHLNNLRDYGVIYGFNPIWSVSVTVFHTVISVLLPQKLFQLITPKTPSKKYLSNKVLIFLSILFLLNGLITGLFTIATYNLPVGDMLIKMFLCLVFISGLIYLAFISRGYFDKQSSSLDIRPYQLTLLAFSIQFFNLIVPYRFESAGISSTFTIIIMLLVNTLFFGFAFNYSFFYHCNIKQFKCLFWGSMMIFVYTSCLRLVMNITFENGFFLFLWIVVLLYFKKNLHEHKHEL